MMLEISSHEKEWLEKVQEANNHGKILIDELFNGVETTVKGVEMIVYSTDYNPCKDPIITITYKLAKDCKKYFSFELFLRDDSQSKSWVDKLFISEKVCSWALWKIDSTHYSTDELEYFKKMDNALLKMNDFIFVFRKSSYEAERKAVIAEEMMWNEHYSEMKQNRYIPVEKYSAEKEYLEDWEEYIGME